MEKPTLIRSQETYELGEKRISVSKEKEAEARVELAVGERSVTLLKSEFTGLGDWLKEIG